MSADEKRKVADFFKEHHLGVIATSISSETSPESALIAFVEDENLCLFFQTGTHTRKATNLIQNPCVSLVIGFDLKDMATVQYEGKAKQLESKSQIKACKEKFLVKKSPTTTEYLERPDAVFFKITPTWIKYTDYSRGKHPSIIELKF